MKKNRIAILGTGNAAEALLVHFKNHGIPISGLWGRTEERGTQLSKKLQVPFEKDPLTLIEGSDMIIFAVSDRGIRSLAEELHRKLCSKTDVPDYEGKVFLHLSGALTSAELGVFSEFKGQLLSAHMIQALPAGKNDSATSPDLLDKAWFSLEGDLEACEAYGDILQHCENPYFKISASDKPIYHAAMCVLSNYLVTLNHIGLSLLYKAGIPKDVGFNMIKPLLDGTLKNIELLGTENALTGPIARGDTLTVSAHVSALKKSAPESLFPYVSLGLSTWDISQNKNEEIYKLLKSELDQILEEKVKK